MDTTTGKIITAEEFDKLRDAVPAEAEKFIQIDGTHDQKCPCGSKLEFKDCCFDRFKNLPRRERRKRMRKFFKNK
jgi:uncharacterized protein YchJ